MEQQRRLSKDIRWMIPITWFLIFVVILFICFFSRFWCIGMFFCISFHVILSLLRIECHFVYKWNMGLRYRIKPVSRKVWRYQSVIRSRNSKKDSQCNGSRIRTKGQAMIYKPLDRKRATRTPMKTVDELRCAGKGKQFLPLWFPLIVRHESK